MLEFLCLEEATARKRVIGIASSILKESNPGRKKKCEERRKSYIQLCYSYKLMGIEDWWMSCIAVFSKYS